VSVNISLIKALVSRLRRPKLAEVAKLPNSVRYVTHLWTNAEKVTIYTIKRKSKLSSTTWHRNASTTSSNQTARRASNEHNRRL